MFPNEDDAESPANLDLMYFRLVSECSSRFYVIDGWKSRATFSRVGDALRSNHKYAANPLE